MRKGGQTFRIKTIIKNKKKPSNIIFDGFNIFKTDYLAGNSFVDTCPKPIL